MVNYQNGKVYRIICNKTGKQYIGSTTIALSARLSQHSKLFRNARTCLSREVIEGGDYAICLIEDFPCDRKEQLLARERHFIETLDCVNKKVPLRTKHEWYMENRDELIRKQLIWNNANKDKTQIYKQRFAEKQMLNNQQEEGIDIDEEYEDYVNNYYRRNRDVRVMIFEED
jgi:hypothetical protein